MGAVESDSVKSARKAKDKLHKVCERASETRERTLHGQEQNRMCMPSMRESQDSVRFLVNTQVQSHALLRRGFGASVPFICWYYKHICTCASVYSNFNIIYTQLCIKSVPCYNVLVNCELQINGEGIYHS